MVKMIPPRTTQIGAAPKDPDAVGFLRFSCDECGRSYRIRRTRIPLTASAVYCKGCGKKIRIRKMPPTARPATSLPAERPAAPPRFRIDLMTPQKRTSRRRFLL
jgi:predicted Zn finger-like uncharacterized protein